MDEYGHLPASSLKKLSYRTAPMVHAHKFGAQYDPIDLAPQIEAPADDTVSATVAAFRAIAYELPNGEDGSRVDEGIAAHVASMDAIRREATSDLIG